MSFLEKYFRNNHLELSSKLLDKIKNTKSEHRAIFEKCEFDSREIAMIKGLREKMAKRKMSITPDVTEGKLLRFLYASFFNPDKTIEVNKMLKFIKNFFWSLEKHLKWLDSKNNSILSEQAEKIIVEDILGIIGRTKKKKLPIILINLKNYTPNIENKFLFEALEYIILQTQNYLFYPGKIEKYTVLIDMASNEINCKFDEFLYYIQILMENFPECSDNIHIINPSQKFLETIWYAILKKKVIDEKVLKRIYFYCDNIYYLEIPINLKELSELQKEIKKKILPCYLGGEKKNLKYKNLLSTTEIKDEMLTIEIKSRHLEIQSMDIEKQEKELERERLKITVKNLKEEIEKKLIFLRQKTEQLSKENQFLKTASNK